MKNFKKLTAILFGNLCVAAAVVFFLTPAGFITGGATGLALLTEQYLDLPLAFGIAFFSVLILLIGWLFLGRAFAATSAISAVSYPIFVWICEQFDEHVFHLHTTDTVLNLSCTVLLFGYGIALVMRQGASTGGLDTIAMILHKKRGVSLAIAVAVLEVLAMAPQAIYSTTEEILGGILLTVFYTAVMNHFIARGTARVQVMVYSRKHREINEYINTVLSRGSTLFRVQGGFSKEDSVAVQTVVSYRELFGLKEAVLKIDEYAFMTISEISEVSGNGFTHDVDLPAHARQEDDSHKFHC